MTGSPASVSCEPLFRKL